MRGRWRAYVVENAHDDQTGALGHLRFHGEFPRTLWNEERDQGGASGFQMGSDAFECPFGGFVIGKQVERCAREVDRSMNSAYGSGSNVSERVNRYTSATRPV